MIVSIVGLPVWLCAGKAARNPPATPLTMKALRGILVSNSDMLILFWTKGFRLA
jgi:hypothetical protein